MMSDVTTPVEKLRAAFGKTIADVAILHGIPLVRVGKADVPLAAHYLHTHPELQGALPLLWDVDQRAREKCHKFSYMFTLSDPRQCLLLATELLGEDRLFLSITRHMHAGPTYGPAIS